MIVNNNAATQNSSPQRAKRIAKRQKPVVESRSILFKPIDEVIGQCMDIHKTLQRSHQMLTDFNRELRNITEYLDQMRFEDHPDDLTVWNFEAERSDITDHRNLFARLESDENCSDAVCSEEQFKNEIFGLKKSKGSRSIEIFSMATLDADSTSLFSGVQKRLRAASVGDENDG